MEADINFGKKLTEAEKTYCCESEKDLPENKGKLVLSNDAFAVVMVLERLANLLR